MVATLLKVLTTGIQDGRIHSSPTLYPFLKVWYKVGRFTTQWVRLDFDSLPEFGRTSIARLQRKGHLCTRLVLVAEMPDISGVQTEALRLAVEADSDTVYPKFGWTNSLGHALIEQLTLDIGGTRIEQLDSRLLEILDEYNTPLEKVTAVNRLLPRLDNGFSETSFGYSSGTRAVVNLPFWFARGDPVCALPIDAILADEVRIGVTFRAVDGLYYTNSRRNPVPMGIDQGTQLWPLAGSSFYRPDPVGGIVVPGLNPSDASMKFTQIPDIQMPSRLQLGTVYLMAEYVYVDQPEASRLRLADIQVPIVQHYAMKPFDTQGLPRAIIELNVPNPVRELYWMVQRQEAPSYNAHFLATRDLRPTGQSAQDARTIWWPDASGLYAHYPAQLIPGFSTSDSEPVKAVGIVYEGNLVRARTETPSLFRGVLPSYQLKKSPWLNRYYYAFSFGVLGNRTAFSAPRGEANMDKIRKRELYLEFASNRGCRNPNDVPAYVVYVYAETYNVFRVYGGRAGCLFAY